MSSLGTGSGAESTRHEGEAFSAAQQQQQQTDRQTDRPQMSVSVWPCKSFLHTATRFVLHTRKPAWSRPHVAKASTGRGVADGVAANQELRGHRSDAQDITGHL
jgi:hypothetical protein